MLAEVLPAVCIFQTVMTDFSLVVLRLCFWYKSGIGEAGQCWCFSQGIFGVIMVCTAAAWDTWIILRKIKWGGFQYYCQVVEYYFR